MTTLNDKFPTGMFFRTIRHEYPELTIVNTLNEDGCITVFFNHDKIVPNDPVAYVKKYVEYEYDGNVIYTLVDKRTVKFQVTE